MPQSDNSILGDNMTYYIEDLDRMSDTRLLDIIHNDPENSSFVMDYFIERHKGLVRIQARSLFLIGGDREDLLQEGMIGLYKALREFDPAISDNFEGFAKTIVYQQMCNAIKASTRKKNLPLNDYISFSSPVAGQGNNETSQVLLSDVIMAATNSNPEELIIDKENASMIEYELGKRLSKLEKSVYDMYTAGMDYRQIAEALCRTPKAIDNALTRIRNKLSAMLS